MFKRLAILSLATMSVAPAAWARPGGSYQQTCDVLRQRGPFLTAECETRDGDTRVTSLDTRMCGGDIANTNGRLTCARAPDDDDDYGYRRGRFYGGYGPSGYGVYRNGFSDD